MKKLFVIGLILVLSLLNIEALAEDTEQEILKSDNYEFILLEDGTAKIIRFVGFASSDSLVIPEQLNQHRVTMIGENAFQNIWQISITIPESVTQLENNPFFSCQQLAEIYVSPDHTVFSVINGVLFSKTEKRLICYPSARSDSEYEIPQGIREIGANAFYNCYNLRSVTIPDSVDTIKSNPFVLCNSLRSFIISNDHPYLKVVDGVLYSKTDECLICYPYTFSYASSSKYVIQEGTRVIGDRAFYGCYGLEELTIPDSVTSIGEDAFYGCSRLMITVGRDSYARQYCIENGIKFIYPDSFDWLNN